MFIWKGFGPWSFFASSFSIAWTLNWIKKCTNVVTFNEEFWTSHGRFCILNKTFWVWVLEFTCRFLEPCSQNTRVTLSFNKKNWTNPSKSINLPYKVRVHSRSYLARWVRVSELIISGEEPHPSPSLNAVFYFVFVFQVALQMFICFT